MGVHGLWKLIEPSGKPVPLETLENKVLAVDVSIWLHQLVKGFQDSKGAPVPNAHLLGIYHRICKLLYFRIKPVFVFDGGVPVLKKQTMAKRHQQKSKTLSEADRIHRNLLTTLLKHSAVSKVLSEKAKAAISASLPASKPTPQKKQDDLYVLPSGSLDSTLSSSEDEKSGEDVTRARQYDLHSIDTESVQFKSLPADVRHEILTDLKETRKQSSWGRLHELPTESDDFSVYQMRRLLKRQAVQTALEDVEKEMGGHSLSLVELEKILKDQGVITTSNLKGNRIASDENTRFLLIKDLKQSLEDAKKQNGAITTIMEVDEKEEKSENKSEESVENDEKVVENAKSKADLEYEEDLKRAIALSLEAETSDSKEAEEKTPDKIKTVGVKGKNRMPLSFLEGFTDADFFDSAESSEDELTPTKLTPAQRYMMEYSGLTAHEISRIIESKRFPNKKDNDEKKINTQIKEKPIIEEKEGPHEHVKESKNLAESEEVTDQCPKEIEPEKDSAAIPKSEEEPLTEVNSKKDENVIEQSVTDFKEKEQRKQNVIILQNIEVTPSTKENKVPSESVFIEESSTEKSVTPVKTASETITEQDEEMEDKQAEVEIMSDSDSSGSDFVEVEESNKEKVPRIPTVEVVIQPDEEMEDDLFKDIFDNEDKPIKTSDNVESTNNIENESFSDEIKTNKQLTAEKPKPRDDLESVFASEISPEKGRPNIPSLYDKINKMIKNYTTDNTDTEKPELSIEKMKEMQKNLNKEQEELIVEKSNKERLAGNITDQMYQEAQELLELFGVPYLIAPMEAEAQCAFLDLINLTDGTITDDSDIWLFGGRTVYKNFFNQSKTVLEFKSENIHHHFKLTREQMILLAMLVGSDYTVGISGVGPVTALEILAAFPPKSQLLSGLMEFKSWFNKGKLPGPGRTALRSKLKNVSFTEHFPNPQIAQAYLEPQVETSKDKFSWAKPDVVGLVDFTKQKFGWTQQKTEEILNPILRRLEDHRKQKSITDYYKVEAKIYSNEAEAKMSKRVKTAVSKIGKQGSVSDEDEPEPKKKKVCKKEEKDVGEKVESKSKTKKVPSKKSKPKIDEDLEFLKKTEATSEKKLEEIQIQIQRKMEEEKEKKKVNLISLHKKEVIPQKQKDKSDMLKNKLKAIEMFRKSKQGPGYVKKRGKIVRALKEDASYLSESSDSD